MSTLPGKGGGAIGAYQLPTLPATLQGSVIGSSGAAAAKDLLTLCQMGKRSVLIPGTAGNLGVVNLGNVDDCDIALEPSVVIDLLIIGSLPGPTKAPSHRVRIRGGQIGSILVAGESTDIVFDAVTLNQGVLPPAQRNGTGIHLMADAAPDAVVDRFAFVNSIARMLPTPPNGNGDVDGALFLGVRARNVFFGNNNMVSAGNRNAWGFRIGGGDNYIIVDNAVRVSFHKLVRMNDNPVDYVFIKGGLWMREATLTAGGLLLNDSFAQLGSSTHQVYIHDPVVYLLPDAPVSFGATSGPEQAGKRWEARRIQWHALGDTVVSDAHLSNLASSCTSESECDYGIGTHKYTYDPNLAFPPTPWRPLPAFADSSPDNLPVAP